MTHEHSFSIPLEWRYYRTYQYQYSEDGQVHSYVNIQKVLKDNGTPQIKRLVKIMCVCGEQLDIPYPEEHS